MQESRVTHPLTAANVASGIHAMLIDSLYRPDEMPTDGSLPEGAVIVECVRGKIGMHPTRLEAHRDEVCKIIDLLPAPFHKVGEGAGGGWSFLNLAMLADGTQWGEHPNCDELIALAFGLKMGAFLMPRVVWAMLPGGMPYLWLDGHVEP